MCCIIKAPPPRSRRRLRVGALPCCLERRSRMSREQPALATDRSAALPWRRTGILECGGVPCDGSGLPFADVGRSIGAGSTVYYWLLVKPSILAAGLSARQVVTTVSAAVTAEGNLSARGSPAARVCLATRNSLPKPGLSGQFRLYSCITVAGSPKSIRCASTFCLIASEGPHVTSL